MLRVPSSLAYKLIGILSIGLIKIELIKSTWVRLNVRQPLKNLFLLHVRDAKDWPSLTIAILVLYLNHSLVILSRAVLTLYWCLNAFFLTLNWQSRFCLGKMNMAWSYLSKTLTYACLIKMMWFKKKLSKIILKFGTQRRNFYFQDRRMIKYHGWDI